VAITATELKANLSKYLELAKTEDVIVTKNGKVVAKITSPFKDKVEDIRSLAGIIPDNIMLEDAREERLNRI
jgi:prevent-host-death family protein